MASTYLSRTIGTATGTTKGTFSCWVKRSGLTDGRMFTSWGTSTRQFWILFQSDKISIADYDGSYNLQYVTNRLFRDTSSWYAITVEIDTTLATASDRVKLYVNGVQETSFATSTAPSQNQVLNFSNSGDSHRVGVRDGDEYFDGLMSQVIFVDGTAYAASTFGSTDSTSGEWKPNANPTVSYGNNGFKLTFEDTSNLGDDTSGNTNDFTMSGTGTSTLDCPSNVYTIWNNLNRATAAGIQANGIQNGNTYIATVAQNQNQSFASTLAFSGTGKFYMEFKVGNIGTDYAVGIGEAETMSSSLSSSSPFKFCNNAKGWAYVKDGNKETGGSGSSYGNSFTSYDYIGVAYNNGALWFSKNGTWQNSATISEINAGTTTNAAFTGIDTSKQYFIMFAGYNDAMIEMNAGNGYFRTTVIGSPNNPTSGDTNAKFKYTVPTGYQPLSTKGLNV